MDGVLFGLGNTCSFGDNTGFPHIYVLKMISMKLYLICIYFAAVDTHMKMSAKCHGPINLILFRLVTHICIRKPLLLYIMACRRFGAKSSYKVMLSSRTKFHKITVIIVRQLALFVQEHSPGYFVWLFTTILVIAKMN